MRRLLTIPVALVLVATLGAGVAGAFFASQRSSAGSRAAAGTIDLDGVTEGTAVIDQALIQGTSAAKIVELRHVGDVPGTLFVTPRDPAGALRPALDLKVELCGTSGSSPSMCAAPAVVFDGPFDTVVPATPPPPYRLTAVAPGVSRFARVTLSWPPGRSHGASGSPTAAMNLRWTLRTVAQ